MPTLSVIAIYFDPTGYVRLRWADQSTGIIYHNDPQQMTVLAEGLDTSAWIALKEAFLKPEQWITV